MKHNLHDYKFTELRLARESFILVGQVYYHLGSFKDSLTFALGAGQKFDVNGTTEYIETILCEFHC